MTWAAAHGFGAGNPLTGVLAVAVLLLVTRGLHVDGLADTADGLGCYGPPERALAVMRDGSAGPFGVRPWSSWLIVVQGLAFSAVEPGWRWSSPSPRAGWRSCWPAGVRCPPRRAARSGAVVAGTQPSWVVAAWVLAVAAAAAFATPRLWQGPLAVLVALAVTAALVRTACAGSAGSPATCWARPSR